jgi:hypothetical protein
LLNFRLAMRAHTCTVGANEKVRLPSKVIRSSAARCGPGFAIIRECKHQRMYDSDARE